MPQAGTAGRSISSYAGPGLGTETAAVCPAETRKTAPAFPIGSRYKSAIVSSCKNEQTDKEFDDAIAELLAFEKKHGLEEK